MKICGQPLALEDTGAARQATSPVQELTALRPMVITGHHLRKLARIR